MANWTVFVASGDDRRRTSLAVRGICAGWRVLDYQSATPSLKSAGAPIVMAAGLEKPLAILRRTW